MSFRSQGVQALSTVLNNQKNITILEKIVFAKTEQDDDDYRLTIYQVVADLKAQKPIKEIYRSIKNGKFGWKHHSFQEMSRCITEQNDFIENPFEVEEGVHTCRKCGSRRVFSYNKQVRGSDEGTSVFCECVACHSKWKESG